MRHLIVPALATLLASCAPGTGLQSLASDATSRSYSTTCAAALTAVAEQARQFKPASTNRVEWNAWAVKTRTTTAVTLQSVTAGAVANATVTCAQTGNRVTLTMRSSGPSVNVKVTNEGYLAGLNLPQ